MPFSFTSSGSGSGTGPQGPEGPQGQEGPQGPAGADGVTPFTIVGPYDNGVSYNLGVAVYSNGGTYVRTGNPLNPGYPPAIGSVNESWTPIAEKGDQGFQGDPGLRFMGQWDDIRTFVINDVVTINGESFVSILGSTAVSPYDTMYWTKLAARGNDANTADFTFEASTMSTNEDMDINVLGVPGIITLSAYAGVNVQTHEDFGLTANKIITSSNGAIDNVKIGDDAWIGDGNIANNIVVIGQQDATQGGVALGSNKTESVFTDGTNLNLEADNDIILYPGSSYAYLGAPTVGGETRIATRGYVDALGTTTSTYTPNWTGTGLAYTGTPAVGSYVKIGNLVTFHIQVTLTNVSNFGTGQYFITLPFAPIGDYAFRDGGLHVAGNHYTVMADAEAGTTSMDLWYIAGTGQDMPMNHSSPHTLTTTSKFYINGTYITSN